VDDGLHLRVGIQPFQTSDQALQHRAFLICLDLEVGFVLFVCFMFDFTSQQALRGSQARLNAGADALL